jgi:hypothetical protein
VSEVAEGSSDDSDADGSDEDSGDDTEGTDSDAAVPVSPEGVMVLHPARQGIRRPVMM